MTSRASLRTWLRRVAAVDGPLPDDATQAAAMHVCRWLLGRAAADHPPASADCADHDAQLILALADPTLASAGTANPHAAVALLEGADPWGETNRLSLAALAAANADGLQHWHREVKAAASRTVHRLRRVDPVAAVGVWAHLAPVELACGPMVRRSPRLVDWLLRRQHRDGLAYPIAGGGACPDYNFLSVVLALEHERLISRDRAGRAVDRLLDALERELRASLVAESFRTGPLPLYRRIALPPSARAWTGPRAVRELGLVTPDWFSTMLRVVTVLAALGWTCAFERDPSTAMHHLGCWLPSGREGVLRPGLHDQRRAFG